MPPKRTTPFQAIVHLVRQQTADPGVTVTESKHLPDPRPGVGTREVDVVVEGHFDGDPRVTSIEVIEHTRRASVTWVEQMINKHRLLPTNRLILVSKSGFSPRADAAVQAEGGWVEAMTPDAVVQDGEALTWSWFIDQIHLTPTRCRLTIDETAGPLTLVAQADNVIFDGEEQPLGYAVHLAREAVNIPWLIRTFQHASHNHPERDKLKGFNCSMVIESLGYHLRNDATSALHRILTIDIEGTFVWEQAELKFTTHALGGRTYDAGEGTIFGQKGVWVATKNEATGATTFSWRLIGVPATPPEQAPEAPPLGFPALRDLEPPPGWDVETAGLLPA